MSRKVPEYVGIAKKIRAAEESRSGGGDVFSGVYGFVTGALGFKPDAERTQIGSAVVSLRPGDGSAREQAASCQRVLGGIANICVDYATKRYRSNLINWGMLPFTYASETFPALNTGDVIYIGNIKKAVENGVSDITGMIIRRDKTTEKLALKLPPLTAEERKIILSGCLINSCGSR